MHRTALLITTITLLGALSSAAADKGAADKGAADRGAVSEGTSNPPTAPQPAPEQELNSKVQAWDQCIARLRSGAITSGIDQATVTEVFEQVTELPRVVQSDRQQPEFTSTFTDYYERRVTDFRVTKGRKLLRDHAPLLADIQAQTGIPAQYLVSFWGLETNFGSYFGKLSIPSALTTLACDGRRAKFFTAELYATLRIIAAGDIATEDLIGSWAGAIGHMQFMPTTYLAYAVDGDGDGRRDLLGSIPDALTSGAKYLARSGWQAGYRWGREVRLPEGFDYALTGSDQWRPLHEWSALGVTDTFGRAIAKAPFESALLLPSGHSGPAFLAYPNFRVIMRWNRSEAYALSVGRLADRIAGAGKLDTPLPNTADARFSTQAIIDLQTRLNQLGFNTGKPDGLVGPATRKAIRSYQQKHGHIADGFPTEALFAAVANHGKQP